MGARKSNNKPKNGVGTDLIKLQGNLPANVTREKLLQMYKEDLIATVEGVVPRLPQIKILHAGALMFEMPPDESGKEPKVDSFEGILIDQHPCNAWWEKSYQETGGGEQPDCSSLDGINGILDGGDAIECITCPHNQWGSGRDDQGEKTRGKACKNMKRLHILMNEHELPRRLTLPPSSIKEADIFLSTLRDRNIPMTSAKLRFSLIEGTNKQGIKYSEIHFEYLGQIAIEEYLKIKEFLRQHKAQIRGQEIKGEEYIPNEKNEETENIQEGTLDEALSFGEPKQ